MIQFSVFTYLKNNDDAVGLGRAERIGQIFSQILIHISTGVILVSMKNTTFT